MTRKSVNQITSEFRPYWESYFEEKGLENPIFLAKLCYSSNDFGSEKEACLRFYPSELIRNQDIYVELFDWEDKPYTGERILYKYSYNPDWESQPFIYKKTKKTDGSPLPTPTYAYKLSNLEFVTKQEKESEPIEVKSTFKPIANLWNTSENENQEEETMIKEKEDAHYAQMTIRDIYCIVNNVPQSNKTWLNTLIKQQK
jgi:hypothetical protein